MDEYVVFVCVAAGVGIAGLWTLLIVRRNVPELSQGLASIRFHIAAEFLMAAALLLGGLALWIGAPWAPPIAAAALGGALYSSINSPGYYADRGQRSMVLMFGLVALFIGTALLAIILSSG